MCFTNVVLFIRFESGRGNILTSQPHPRLPFCTRMLIYSTTCRLLGGIGQPDVKSQAQNLARTLWKIIRPPVMTMANQHLCLAYQAKDLIQNSVPVCELGHWILFSPVLRQKCPAGKPFPFLATTTFSKAFPFNYRPSSAAPKSKQTFDRSILSVFWPLAQQVSYISFCKIH